MAGTNVVEAELSIYPRMHNIVNIMHTVPYLKQQDEILVEAPNNPYPLPTDKCEQYLFEATEKHRKKGKVFQFLTNEKICLSKIADKTFANGRFYNLLCSGSVNSILIIHGLCSHLLVCLVWNLSVKSVLPIKVYPTSLVT